MSYNKKTYVARKVNAAGYADYSAEDNAVWHQLITRQTPIVTKGACPEYLHGLQLLNLPTHQVPQCPDISNVLKKETGWSLEPVPALIDFEHFFHLLANKRFPAATFIRTKEELDYVQEPDIFHEIFGHCPLLTNPAYAEFTHLYGKLGTKATPKDRVMLARLYWFTIEFGLINTPKGLRAYGGGILSSINETTYCLESDIPKRLVFDPIEALRTPYRIDIMQPIYFVLDSFDTLYRLTEMNLIDLVHQARERGEYSTDHLKLGKQNELFD